MENLLPFPTAKRCPWLILGNIDINKSNFRWVYGFDFNFSLKLRHSFSLLFNAIQSFFHIFQLQVQHSVIIFSWQHGKLTYFDEGRPLSSRVSIVLVRQSPKCNARAVRHFPAINDQGGPSAQFNAWAVWHCPVIDSVCLPL